MNETGPAQSLAWIQKGIDRGQVQHTLYPIRSSQVRQLSQSANAQERIPGFRRQLLNRSSCTHALFRKASANSRRAHGLDVVDGIEHKTATRRKDLDPFAYFTADIIRVPKGNVCWVSTPPPRCDALPNFSLRSRGSILVAEHCTD